MRRAGGACFCGDKLPVNRAKIADSLRALEESDRRMELEKQRLEILRMRATGAVDVPDPDGTAADDLDAPLEEDTEE